MSVLTVPTLQSKDVHTEPVKMSNATKTDLHVLLECLKYQMKCPDSQKQALLTIVSICQQNGQNIDFLKEIGGVKFIYNLSRSSHSSAVKETALFTLGSLAEINESCKQALCREEIFSDLAECMKHDVSFTQKRVAVYMLCALVSNNRRGQSFAKTSGCIDILLKLFRDSFPVSDGPNEMLPLWTSLSSALCGCVNNPQNEENQRACMFLFPLVKAWLLQISLLKPELAQPICSFTGMTVASNACAQEYFASVGGLVTLADTLAKMAPQCKDKAAACKLAAMITRTLSACIADNVALVPVLSELRVVPDLLLLLSSPNLSPQDQLVVVLTLGHCTDACVEHQSQLLLGGGLPLMISLLTDTNDEEVRKAAIFVLQTCKKIMESLGGSISSQSEKCDLQKHWQSAREMLQRIQHLEKRQLKEEDHSAKDTENSPDWRTQPVLLRPACPVECREELWEDSVVRKVKGRCWLYEEESDRENIMFTTPAQPSAQQVTTQRMQNLEPKQHVRRQIFRDFDKTLSLSQMREERQEPIKKLEGRVVVEKNEQQKRGEERMKMERGEREASVKMKAHLSTNTDTGWAAGSPSRDTFSKPPVEGDKGMQSPDIFRHPAPMKRRQQKQAHSEDELSICSELLENEIKRILITPHVSKPSSLRCAGCVSGANEVDSRSVGSVLRSCRCLCEFHLVLQQAEDCFKRGLRHDLNIGHNCRDRDDCFQSISKHTSIEGEGRVGNAHRLGALRFLSLTPLKRPCEVEASDMEKRKVSRLHETVLDKDNINSSNRRRERTNYTTQELAFLSEGVRRFGNSWNSTLWAYPFQHGRTNVDLAKKYRKLKQGLAQAPDLLTLDSAEQ